MSEVRDIIYFCIGKTL
jgi:hypothetical protein